MTTNTTVAIAPEAALRAVSTENEWRRNRILVLENEVVRLERELEAAKAGTETVMTNAVSKREVVGKAKKDAQ